MEAGAGRRRSEGEGGVSVVTTVCLSLTRHLTAVTAVQLQLNKISVNVFTSSYEDVNLGKGSIIIINSRL